MRGLFAFGAIIFFAVFAYASVNIRSDIQIIIAICGFGFGAMCVGFFAVLELLERKTDQ